MRRRGGSYSPTVNALVEISMRARGPVRLWYLETRQSRVRALDATLLEAKVVKGLGRRNSQGKAMQPGHVHREEAPFRPLGEIAELLPQ